MNELTKKTLTILSDENKWICGCKKRIPQYNTHKKRLMTSKPDINLSHFLAFKNKSI